MTPMWWRSPASSKRPRRSAADDAAALVPAEAGDHAVGGAGVLDLDVHPLVRPVRLLELLGDDAVEAGALEAVEPVPGGVGVGGRRREVERRLDVGHDLGEDPPALPERQLAGVVVAEGEEVEGDERRRDLGGELLHPRLGGVHAQLQGVEVEAARRGDDDLAVDHDVVGQLVPDRVDELWEVAGERALVAGAEVHLVAAAEHDAPEPVPLRLVRPGVADGELLGRLGEHRRDRRRHDEIHGLLPSCRGRRPSQRSPRTRAISATRGSDSMSSNGSGSANDQLVPSVVPG